VEGSDEWPEFKVLYWNMPRETGNPRKTSISIVGVPDEIRTGYLFQYNPSVAF
jgi:hypothetical protein